MFGTISNMIMESQATLKLFQRYTDTSTLYIIEHTQ